MLFVCFSFPDKLFFLKLEAFGKVDEDLVPEKLEPRKAIHAKAFLKTCTKPSPTASRTKHSQRHVQKHIRRHPQDIPKSTLEDIPEDIFTDLFQRHISKDIRKSHPERHNTRASKDNPGKSQPIFFETPQRHLPRHAPKTPTMTTPCSCRQQHQLTIFPSSTTPLPTGGPYITQTEQTTPDALKRPLKTSRPLPTISPKSSPKTSPKTTATTSPKTPSKDIPKATAKTFGEKHGQGHFPNKLCGVEIWRFKEYWPLLDPSHHGEFSQLIAKTGMADTSLDRGLQGCAQMCSGRATSICLRLCVFTFHLLFCCRESISPWELCLFFPICSRIYFFSGLLVLKGMIYHYVFFP